MAEWLTSWTQFWVSNVSLRFWGPSSKLACNSLIIFLIIGICSDASARKQSLISSYRNDIYTPLTVVSSLMENHSYPGPTPRRDGCVWIYDVHTGLTINMTAFSNPCPFLTSRHFPVVYIDYAICGMMFVNPFLVYEILLKISP